MEEGVHQRNKISKADYSPIWAIPKVQGKNKRELIRLGQTAMQEIIYRLEQGDASVLNWIPVCRMA